MTALELIRAGVRFARNTSGLVAVAGPEGRADLLTTLRAEVARRVSLVREPRKLHGGEQCELCGDALEVGRGGWCFLCVIARQKGLLSMGAITTKPRAIGAIQ